MTLEDAVPASVAGPGEPEVPTTPSSQRLTEGYAELIATSMLWGEVSGRDQSDSRITNGFFFSRKAPTIRRSN